MRRTRSATRGASPSRPVWHLIILAVVLLLFVPIGPILFPPPGTAREVDVVLVLGPPTPSRLQLAKDLMDQGYSENLIISASTTSWYYNASRIGLCTADLPYSVTCEQSDPFTTQGEIGLLQRLSEENGWRSAIVITFPPQVARARLYADRCYSGTVEYVSADQPLAPLDSLGEYAYQLGGFIKAGTLTTGCAQ